MAVELTEEDLEFLLDLVTSDEAQRDSSGFGNNIANPTWGAADQPFIRLTASSYADGISVPRTTTHTPREISDILVNQDTDGDGIEESIPNQFGGNSFLTFFGQYFDHGLDFVGKSGSFAIGSATFPMNAQRANIMPGTGNRDGIAGTADDIPAEHINKTSPFVDQNQAYGSHNTVTDLLRRWEIADNGSKVQTAYLLTGELDETGRALLPTLGHIRDNYRIMTDGGELTAGDISNYDGTGHALLIDFIPAFTPTGEFDLDAIDHYYVGGDGRANENVMLTSIHTIWARNHNFWVDELIEKTGGAWTQEQYFQAARVINIAEYQRVVFTEFADAMAGGLNGGGTHGFGGYDPSINPGISAEFAHVAYRFGHSMLNETVSYVDGDTGDLSQISLVDAFLSPQNLAALGVGNLIQGSTAVEHQAIDIHMVNALRNQLVGRPLDLAALNIFRGRDTGVGTLNEVRAGLFARFGDNALRPYADWEDFQDRNDISDELMAKLREAYPEGLDAVDLWVGGLLEKAREGQLGSTFATIFLDQLDRLQEGDRFYYLHQLDDADFRDQINDQTFAEIIARNTGLTDLPENIFQALTLPTDPPSEEEEEPSAPPAANLPSEHADDLSGTDDADTIDARGGNDAVRAGAGNDEVAGGTGNDELFGGDGHDYLAGGDGNDLLEGDAGNDELFGEAGSDELYGGAGNDLLDGGLGHDELYGGADHDELHGREGSDHLDGGDGDDLIYGGADDDELLGGEGDDELDGGEGVDTAVYTGNRTDYDVMTAADGSVIVRHKNGGPDGTDTLIDIEALQFADDLIAPPPPAGNPPTTPPTELQQLTADANGEYAIAGLRELRISTAFFSAEAAYNNVFGYYVADATGKPIGGAVIETIARETSDDPTVTVDLSPYPEGAKLGFFVIPNGGSRNPGLSDGAAVTFAQTGGAWAVYAGGAKLIGDGANVYFTNAALNADGFDHVKDVTALHGNQNWEDLRGGGDKDFDDLNVDVTVKAVVQAVQVGSVEIQDSTPTDGRLTASVNNSLTANIHLLLDPSGISQIQYQWQSSSDGHTWTPIAGANRERFSPRQSELGLSLRVALTYVLIDSAYQQITTYSPPTPVVTAAVALPQGSGQPPAENGAEAPASEQASTETPNGNGAPPPPADIRSLSGGEGSDHLHGSSGSDMIMARGGSDVVSGGKRADYIYGGEGNDVLFGGMGNDVLHGDAGNDWLFGGRGDDWLFGGKGNDRLFGGSGNDKLRGDEGDDVLHGGQGTDDLDGGQGADKLYGGDDSDVLYGGESSDLLAGGSGGDALHGGNGDDGLFGGSGNDQLAGNAGDDWLNGGSGDDKLDGGDGHDGLAGGDGHDELKGGSGNDDLDGGRGNDVLYGGSGDDCLDGGDGDDIMHSGSGNDVLYGGAGRDTFVYWYGDGDDEIMDFQDDYDVLTLQGDSAAAYTVTATDYGRDYVFNGGGKLAVHSNSGKGSHNSGSGNSGHGSGRNEDDWDDDFDYSDFGGHSDEFDADGDEWADLVAGGVFDVGGPGYEADQPGSLFEDASLDALLGVSMITFSHEDHNLFG